jgi:hypothetical protein
MSRNAAAPTSFVERVSKRSVSASMQSAGRPSLISVSLACAFAAAIVLLPATHFFLPGGLEEPTTLRPPSIVVTKQPNDEQSTGFSGSRESRPAKASSIAARQESGPLTWFDGAAFQLQAVPSLVRALQTTLWPPVGPTARDDPLFANIDILNLPMGMQNSNPGNIKFDVANYWPGQLGPSINTDQGEHQIVFDNASDGMFAAAQLILRKFGWGHSTVRDIIANRRVGWTPGYISGAKGVAEASGFRLDQRLDLRNPEVLARLLRGIVTQEHGPSSKLYSDKLIQDAANAALSSSAEKPG